MHVLRGLAALTVALTLLSSVSPVSAQVDEAEDRAQRAADELDAAYAVVSDATSDAEAIEAALFTALDEYQTASLELAAAGVRLRGLSDALVFADAEALAAEDQLHDHTVNAYMEAVTSTASLVFDTESIEDALFVGQIVRESQSNALITLSDLLAQRNELERLQAEHAIEVVQVESWEQELASRAEQLQEMFSTANAEVAAAYTRAAEADAAYRAALDGVDRAIAEEEAARRAETNPTSTTSTTAPSTTTSGPTTTTTTAAGNSSTTSTTPTTTSPTTTTTAPSNSEWPPIPISDQTMSWRPLIEKHFASDLVLDALVIVQCESRGDPDAVNPYSGASGLFQFMPGTWAVASVQAGVGDRSVFDGEANIIAASWLAEYYRDRVGEPWRPWSCRAYL